MLVTLDFENKVCKVLKEKDDSKFRHSGWTSAESTFLYHVLQSLKSQGYNVMKKRMWKDGHLVCDHQQYIRTKKISGGFFIYNDEYSISDLGLEFNGIFSGDEMTLPMGFLL